MFFSIFKTLVVLAYLTLCGFLYDSTYDFFKSVRHNFPISPKETWVIVFFGGSLFGLSRYFYEHKSESDTFYVISGLVVWAFVSALSVPLLALTLSTAHIILFMVGLICVIHGLKIVENLFNADNDLVVCVMYSSIFSIIVYVLTLVNNKIEQYF